MRRVAIILNRNAQGVTASRVAQVRMLAGEQHVFVTATTEDARRAIATIVARGYDVLCTGGGDGTFVQASSELRAHGRWPILFGLRLGSGNAIADVCGARRPTRRGLAADLARAAGDEPPGRLRLLDVGGRLAFSAGFGLDAEFNEDLAQVAKPALRRRWLRPLVAGWPGLYLTAAVRTVPRLAIAPAHHMRVTAIGPAERLDGHGRTIAELSDGAELHVGPARVCSASTVRTYGRGVEFFPFTEHASDRFQVRVADVGAIGAVRDLVHLLRGAHHAVSGITDHLVRGVRVEVDSRCSAHCGGEVWRPLAPVDLTLSPVSVPILRAR